MSASVLVCGDRNWAKPEKPGDHWGRIAYLQDVNLMFDTLDAFNEVWHITRLIQGEANGADKLSSYWAYHRMIPWKGYPADWNRYGKAAGPIRNQQMLDEENPDFVVAFHRNIERSKGTRHMIQIAQKRGIPTFLVPDYALR